MTKKFKAAEDFTPNPINLLESNRSLGYSIEEAVSDLIDNSIAADAKNISFNLKWNSGKPYFTLVDDGKGMTKNELIESFKLGSRNPNDTRDVKDLGRFGCDHLLKTFIFWPADDLLLYYLPTFQFNSTFCSILKSLCLASPNAASFAH